MTKPYRPNDRYAQRAREHNYRARSVYKLMELNQKFHLIKEGMRVLDVAASPGSWTQYASEIIGPTGHVLAIDIQKIDPIANNVTTAICDINDAQLLTQLLTNLKWTAVDLVLSDIAPSTTGISGVDHGRSIELNAKIAEVGKKYLTPGGKLVLKVFEGADFQKFVSELKQQFKSVMVTKVKASRDRSFEKYIICTL